MNKERVIKNLKAIAEAYEKNERLYFGKRDLIESGFDHNSSLNSNLNVMDLEVNDYITESEYNKLKHQDLVGKWLVSRDGYSKHKITKVEGEFISYGDYGMPIAIKDLRKKYILENGEEIM